MDEPGFQSFTLIAALAGAMVLVYVPLRIFLTATERSRRLRLLQVDPRLLEADFALFDLALIGKDFLLSS